MIKYQAAHCMLKRRWLIINNMFKSELQIGIKNLTIFRSQNRDRKLVPVATKNMSKTFVKTSSFLKQWIKRKRVQMSFKNDNKNIKNGTSLWVHFLPPDLGPFFNPLLYF